MKRLLILIGAVFAISGLAIAAFAIYLVAYYTVEPSFSATAYKLDNGDYRIDIEPNFVVYAVYGVRVTESTKTLAERDDPICGDQTITIPGSLVSGQTVTVTCDLVYDRPMPSMTTHTELVELPQ